MNASHAYPWGNPKPKTKQYDDAVTFKYVYPHLRKPKDK
jgi:hypothetical protein